MGVYWTLDWIGLVIMSIFIISQRWGLSGLAGVFFFLWNVGCIGYGMVVMEWIFFSRASSLDQTDGDDDQCNVYSVCKLRSICTITEHV